MSSIRDEINWIAEEIQSTAVQARESSSEIVKRVEALFRNASSFDLTLDGMDERYVWRDVSYMWTPDNGEAGCGVVGATGAVPVDDRLRKELRLYEHILPLMCEQYALNRYSDEVLYIDKKSMVVGQTTKNFGGLFPPGFDAVEVCRTGVTYYDYYGWVDHDRNPDRLPRWAPSAFIELLGEFIQSVHAPVYKCEADNEMCGFVGLHYNLEWVNAATVYKSSNRVFILSGQSTLIGASPGALDFLGMEPYARQLPSHLASGKVRKYVDIERNLERDKPMELADLARRVRIGAEFKHTLGGRQFKITRAEVPELGFHVVAVE
jgi:hypothetical protein